LLLQQTFSNGPVQVIKRAHAALNISLNRSQKLIPKTRQKAAANTDNKKHLVIPLQLCQILKVDGHINFLRLRLVVLRVPPSAEARSRPSGKPQNSGHCLARWSDRYS